MALRLEQAVMSKATGSKQNAILRIFLDTCTPFNNKWKAVDVFMLCHTRSQEFPDIRSINVAVFVAEEVSFVPGWPLWVFAHNISAQKGEAREFGC
jgi:hypothetical protein